MNEAEVKQSLASTVCLSTVLENRSLKNYIVFEVERPGWIKYDPFRFQNAPLSTVRYIHVRLEYIFGLEVQSFV